MNTRRNFLGSLLAIGGVTAAKALPIGEFTPVLQGSISNIEVTPYAKYGRGESPYFTILDDAPYMPYPDGKKHRQEPTDTSWYNQPYAIPAKLA